MQKTTKTLCIIITKLMLTTLAFYILSKKITINPLAYLNKNSIDYFLVALSLCIVLILLQAVRWKYIAKIYSIHLSYPQCLISIWFGHLVNNFLPTATAGDLLRSYTIRYANQNSRWQWLGAFLAEKYSAVISALLMATITLSISIAKTIPAPLTVFIIFLFVSLIIIPITGIYLISYLKFKNNLMNYLKEIFKSLSNTFLNKNGQKAFLVSFLTTITMCLIFYVISLGLEIQIKFIQALFAVPIFTILTALPISYAGWGVRELSCAGLLSFFGVPTEIAIIISVMYGLVVLLSSLPGILVAYPFITSIRSIAKKESVLNCSG